MKKILLAACLLAGTAGARAADISSATVQTGVVVSTHFRTNIALDSHNGVHMTFFVQDTPTRLRYAYRPNGATAFTVTDIDLAVGPLSSLALSGTIPHVAYSREDGTLVHARLSGAAWITDDIETDLSTNTFVSLAIGGDDIPQVVYHSSPTNRTAYGELTGAAWSTFTLVTSTFGGPVDLALDAADNPRIAFYTGISTDNVRLVAYAFPVSGLFNVRSLFAVGAGTTTPGDVSIAADSAGRIHVAAFDDFNGGLDYLVASASGTPLGGFVMDNLALSGFQNDLKITSEDRPHILYLSTSVGLRQAVFDGDDFTDPADWSTSTVHIGTNAGVGLSLAENALDHFMVSYYDETNSAVNWLTNLSTEVVITGSVLDFSNAAIPGAALTISGGIASQGVALSTGTGLFSFGPLLEGTYVLTPSLSGYAFVPSRRQITVEGSAANQNFQGGLTGFDLVGNVFDPLQGQQVNINLSVLPGHVLLRLYTLQGRPIKTLLDEERPAGTINLTWDGRTSDGEVVASGLYLLRLDSEHVSGIKKIAVVK